MEVLKNQTINNQIKDMKNKIEYFKSCKGISRFLNYLSPLLFLILLFTINILVCIGLTLAYILLTRFVWVRSSNKSRIYKVIEKKLIEEKNKQLISQFR